MFLSNGTPVNGPIGTLADATPLFATANYYTRVGLSLSKQWAAYAVLYRTQAWVGIVIRKLANATARLPFEVGTTLTGGWESDTTSAEALLFKRPNPRLNPFRLWQWTSATYDLYGESYWLKLRDQDGRVRELHPMHPVNIVTHRNDDGSLVYLYTAGLRQVGILPPIPEEDVVPFVNYNPENAVRGLSNLEGLRQTLLTEDAARRAGESWWARGSRPSMALVHPGTLSKGAKERLKSDWDSVHAGADYMGGTAVLEEGLTPTPLQLTAEEMQYIESRKLNREEVCAAYDVPPPVVHILDNATYSNITEQMRSMYRDTMAPRLEMFEDVVRFHLLPDFPESPDECRFDLDTVLRGDFETRAQATTQLVTSGVMKPAEARPAFGLSEAGPEADRLYANQALQPLGTPVAGAVPANGALPSIPGALPEPFAPKPVDDNDENAPGLLPTFDDSDDGRSDLDDWGTPNLKAILGHPGVRSMLGRLSRTKKLSELREKLAAEHAQVLGQFFARQRAAVTATVGAKALASPLPTLDPATQAGGVQAQQPAFDQGTWSRQLAEALTVLGLVVATAAGGKVASGFGKTFAAAEMMPWLQANATRAAWRINAATQNQLASALASSIDPAAAVDSVFAPLTIAAPSGPTPTLPGAPTTVPTAPTAPTVTSVDDPAVGGRLAQISRTRTVAVAGQAGHEAASQAHVHTKIWHTGENPRESHAAVDGEEKRLGEPFSNGLMYPGDESEGPEESANCNCTLSFRDSESGREIATG